MKNYRITIAMSTILLTMMVNTVWGQQPSIQYFRPYDQRGINVFETSKNDTLPFEGLKVRLGANFTQGFQTLSHENSGPLALYDLAPGFPLAQANLNIDVQLVDGVRVSLVSYMSAHHHNETDRKSVV